MVLATGSGGVVVVLYIIFELLIHLIYADHKDLHLLLNSSTGV